MDNNNNDFLRGRLYVDMEITFKGTDLDDCKKIWSLITKNVYDSRYPYIGGNWVSYSENLCKISATKRLVPAEDQPEYLAKWKCRSDGLL